MSQPCEVKDLPSQPALCIRATIHSADIPKLFDRAYGQIAGYLTANGGQFAGPAYAAYFNMDMDNLKLEVGFPVIAPLAGQGEIESVEIPAGSYAVLLHKGPYQNLRTSYDTLSSWIDAQGYKATGTAYEFYITDPTVTADDDHLTEIRFPLAS